MAWTSLAESWIVLNNGQLIPEYYIDNVNDRPRIYLDPNTKFSIRLKNVAEPKRPISCWALLGYNVLAAVSEGGTPAPGGFTRIEPGKTALLTHFVVSDPQQNYSKTWPLIYRPEPIVDIAIFAKSIEGETDYSSRKKYKTVTTSIVYWGDRTAARDSTAQRVGAQRWFVTP